MQKSVSREEFEVLKKEVENLQEEVKELNVTVTDLKILFEKSFTKLNATLENIEDFMKRNIVFIRDTQNFEKQNIEKEICNIKKVQEEHIKEIRKIQLAIAKFTGAATLAGALSGLITGIILKFLFR